MHAHKLNVTAPADHEIAIRLPDDSPACPAEIIALATRAPIERPRGAASPLEPHPVPGKIIFHEYPARPLDREDWEES